MKLLDFVVREAILVDLQATGKEEAIREIVGSLHRAGQLAEADLESVIRAILGREELGSTGIGQGVAVPHTRHPTVQRLIGTVALSRRGVDFAALDGEPVDIFFLLVSPPNQPGDHLRALENISRHLKDERFVSFLRQAKTRENVIEVLEEADQGASLSGPVPAARPRCRRPAAGGADAAGSSGRSGRCPAAGGGDHRRPIPGRPDVAREPARRSLSPAQADRAADEPRYDRRPSPGRDHQRLGLHLRPADKFVELAPRFQSEIRVHHKGNEINGKSHSRPDDRWPPSAAPGSIWRHAARRRGGRRGAGRTGLGPVPRGRGRRADDGGPASRSRLR